MASDEDYMAFLKKASAHGQPRAQHTSKSSAALGSSHADVVANVTLTSETDAPLDLFEFENGKKALPSASELANILNDAPHDVQEIENGVEWLLAHLGGPQDAVHAFLNAIGHQVRLFKVQIDDVRSEIYIFAVPDRLISYRAAYIES